ncbi:MAG: protein kinase [Nannocystaceae bacterium]
MTKPSGVISGRIADRPVADLLESLHQSGSTGVARFRTALGSATVWLRDGDLIDAEMGRFHQEAAVLRLMKIQDGEFEVESGPTDQPRAILAATPQLLAEARQRVPRPGPVVHARRRSTLAETEASRGQPSGRRAGSGESRGHAAPVRPAQPMETGARDAMGGGSHRTPSGPRTVVSARPGPPAGGAATGRTPSGPRPIVPSRPATPTGSVATGRTPSGPRPVVPSRRATPTSGAPGGLGTGIPSRPAHIPRASDSDEFTTVVSAPIDLLADANGSDEPPTVRARLPPGGLPGAAPPPAPSAAPPSPPRPVSSSQPMAGSRRPSGDDQPIRGRRPSGDDHPVGRRARRPVAASWSPTAGGGGEKVVASPPAASPTSTGRTQFMFGVAPGAPQAPRFGAQPAAEAEDPPDIDRTLMRPGPVPPPPRPVVPPSSGPTPRANRSEPIDVRATPRPEPEVDIEQTISYGAPLVIDEEYSHPISVPADPAKFGPGGTMMIDAAGTQRSPLPLPDDGDKTFVLRRSEVSGRPESGSATTGATPAGTGRTAHVGRYEVLLRLARGGMGTIYLCRITGEGGFRRLFALKVIREHLNRNQAYVDMLLEEARIASRLNHPNIVPILDIDTFAGQHFLVMDYVEGCTFSELLKAHVRSRPPALIIPIILEALTGLHAAHTMRGDSGAIEPLVHCDFSPQNMLVGINGTCRIIDFGVAKAADAMPGMSDRGKPQYLSPEQARGLPVDPRADVFSAGVVLWNALTGQPLFDGATPEQILHQVVTAPVPRPSTVGLRPPACFDAICLKALERDPARRYQSAEQMLTDLRKVAIAEDLLAPSSEVGQWVLDTFGAQIEHRRLAAGLGSDAISTPSPSFGPTGHSDGATGDGSATGDDLDASRTMMLRSPVAPPRAAAEEGLGPRTRVVVLVAAIAFIGAGVLTLFVRPDLLKGGMMDDSGQYIELDDEPVEPVTKEGTTGGVPPAGDTDGTDGDTDGSSGTGTDTEAETDSDGDDEGEQPADDDGGQDKSGRPKGSRGKPKDPKGKPDADEPKDPKGSTKPKDDGGTPPPPPPDLDELFKQPG